MKLDLHVHTKHSFDCDSDISHIIENAATAGLSAIAICDHDTMSACSLAEQNKHDVRIIPGMEITTRGGTHIIGLFLKEEVVSRDILEVIDEIHSQNGLVVVPHPFRPGSGLFFNREKRNLFSGEEMVQIMAGVDLIETINYRSTPEILNETDRIAASHPNKPQTAGSDAHFADEIGRAYVDLENLKSNDLADIKKALLKSPRLIRFEAFSYEDGWQTRSLTIKSRKNVGPPKIKRFVPRLIRNSFKAIFSSSGDRLSKRKSKEKVPIE
ncbi:MAG: PHP-associated domain-containing protein [Candidatus Zixiibacteriota bacterium]